MELSRIDTENSHIMEPSYLPVPLATVTESPDELRARLDGIYAEAFAVAPKPAQFAQLMADAKQVYDQWAKSEENDNLSSFTKDIAENTGLHQRVVQRLVERGRKVHPDVLETVANNPGLNKGVVLEKIAAVQGREAQMKAFDALLAEAAAPKPNTDEQRAEDFLKKFEGLPKAVRDIVIDRLGDWIEKGVV